MSREWSEQQKAIFAQIRDGDPRRNVVITARAGTGKTTTIIEAGKYAPEETILYCAFNKRIEQELAVRLAGLDGAEAKTLHALGFAAVRKFWSGVFIQKTNNARALDLTEQVCGPTAPDPIKKMITNLHTKAREINPLAKNACIMDGDHLEQPGDLTDLAYKFECVPQNGWAGTTWNLEYVEKKSLEAMELAATVKPVKTGIDFSDMIFLPVRNNWVYPNRDLVFVDEAQDMTVAQLAIAQGSCKGRLVVVGDDRQAIYDFRGADSDSLNRLKRELNAVELKLTTTYRCGKRIVDLAQRLVPDFEAGKDNPEGEISSITQDKLLAQVQGGDFVLSRLNAPLVSIAMSLLRNQKRARIAGRDIGAGLKTIIRVLKANGIPDMLKKLDLWEERMVIRMINAKRETQVEVIRDQADTLRVLMQDARGPQEVEQRIDALFTDDGLGQAGVITCSSVHRAKGLEADRVFILRDTLKDHTQEELNIQYVAITRAKKHLIWVSKPREV
jgi:DNA helicase-2/ATP-dependent DNA helicase PcrA